jgi:hypothetical protein
MQESIFLGGFAMSYQTGEFPVTADGRNVGSVTVAHSGLLTVFDSACEHTGPDVFELAAVCGGRAVTLGVLIRIKRVRCA